MAGGETTTQRVFASITVKFLRKVKKEEKEEEDEEEGEEEEED